MNPKNRAHLVMQSPNGQGPVLAPPPPLPRGRIAWVLGASLAIGVGAMSNNSCNINTGTQLIQQAASYPHSTTIERY